MDCPSCKRRSAVNAKFCRYCGTSMKGAFFASGVSPSAVVSDMALRIQQELQELSDDVFGNAVNDGLQPIASDADERRLQESTENGRSLWKAKYAPAWRNGPTNPQGRMMDVSDRNLLCMCVHPGTSSVTVGSADHGLTTYNYETGVKLRTLYSKQYGHSEWVTCCAYDAASSDAPRVVSGGMGHKLCVWETKGPVRCVDLNGHTGSVSAVSVNAAVLAVSSSYDRTLIAWDPARVPKAAPTARGGTSGNASGCLVTRLVGHTSAVQHFVWKRSHLVSSGRDGDVLLWNLNTSQSIGTVQSAKGANTFPCTALHAPGTLMGPQGATESDVPTDPGDASASLVFFGNQKGTVTVWDTRALASRSPVASISVHPGGAVTDIHSIHRSGNMPYIVTAGADRRIAVLDPRATWKVNQTIEEHQDFIYSLETFGPFVLSGAGNGWLLIHDVLGGERAVCCYGLGANKAAVRCIYPTGSHLLAAGDDGNLAVYEYMK